MDTSRRCFFGSIDGAAGDRLIRSGYLSGLMNTLGNVSHLAIQLCRINRISSIEAIYSSPEASASHTFLRDVMGKFRMKFFLPTRGNVLSYTKNSSIEPAIASEKGAIKLHNVFNNDDQLHVFVKLTDVK